jgi:hypothetical protein
MRRAIRLLRPRHLAVAARGALFAGRGATLVGRIVFRRRIAVARRRAMTVVAAATVGGVVVLTLAAERERARQ